MFTGIVTDVGRVVASEGTRDLQVKIASTYDIETIDIGASIACSGVCLTVIEKGLSEDGEPWFKVDVSAETIDKTTAGRWAKGYRLNLERALKIGDELGGHMVSGHVDGLAEIIEITADGKSRRIRFRVAREFAKFVAAKGSVCLDGTSLTVNDVEDCEYVVNIIPHTLEVTTWGIKKKGDNVNFEVDVMARYVARLNSETMT